MVAIMMQVVEEVVEVEGVEVVAVDVEGHKIIVTSLSIYNHRP